MCDNCIYHLVYHSSGKPNVDPPTQISDFSLRSPSLSSASQVFRSVLNSHLKFLILMQLSRFRPPSLVDLRLSCSPWPPDDSQGCTSRLVHESDPEDGSSKLGNETNRAHKKGRSGTQRAEGAVSNYVSVISFLADVSDSNI